MKKPPAGRLFLWLKAVAQSQAQAVQRALRLEKRLGADAVGDQYSVGGFKAIAVVVAGQSHPRIEAVPHLGIQACLALGPQVGVRNEADLRKVRILVDEEGILDTAPAEPAGWQPAVDVESEAQVGDVVFLVLIGRELAVPVVVAGA